MADGTWRTGRFARRAIRRKAGRLPVIQTGPTTRSPCAHAQARVVKAAFSSGTPPTVTTTAGGISGVGVTPFRAAKFPKVVVARPTVRAYLSQSKRGAGMI